MVLAVIMAYLKTQSLTIPVLIVMVWLGVYVMLLPAIAQNIMYILVVIGFGAILYSLFKGGD